MQVQLSGTPFSAPKKRDDCPKAHALVSDYRFTAVLQAHQNLGGAANKESLQSIRKRWLRASTTVDDQTIRKMAGLDPKRWSIALWIRTTTCFSGVGSKKSRSIAVACCNGRTKHYVQPCIVRLAGQTGVWRFHIYDKPTTRPLRS